MGDSINKKIYTNAKLRGCPSLLDILIDDGKFVAIGKKVRIEDENIKSVDLKGKLVLPPYIEPHIHLDYVYTSSEQDTENSRSTLFEGIYHWSKTKYKRTEEEIIEKAQLAVQKQILNGIQHIRTHVDVTDPQLTALKAMIKLREQLQDLVTIQIVAFPQEGMLAFKNGEKLVEEALLLGADVVGAIPHYEHTRELGNRSIYKAIELACKHNKMVDIHCDETDDEQSRFLEVLASEAYSSGIGSRTTASHTCALGSYNGAYAARLFRLLKISGIHFISCPTENLHLQGRYDSYPKRRGLTRVAELLEAGMNVCFAQDSISDPWYPLGSGNLMNVLDVGIHACHLTSLNRIHQVFDLITINGAKSLNITDRYGLEVGKEASFVVLDAQDEFSAICERSLVFCSVRKGELLFERSPREIKTSVEILNRQFVYNSIQ